MAPRLVSGACWVFGSTILDFTFSVICIVLMLARVVRPPAVVVSAEETAVSSALEATENGSAGVPAVPTFCTSVGKNVPPPDLRTLLWRRQGPLVAPGAGVKFLLSTAT